MKRVLIVDLLAERMGFGAAGVSNIVESLKQIKEEEKNEEVKV